MFNRGRTAREVIAHLGDKDFNIIPIKIPGSYFVDPDQLIWMFIGKGKEHRITNIILKGEDKVRGWHYPTSSLVIKLQESRECGKIMDK